MALDQPNDRHEEPGWRDYLEGEPGTAYEGEDRLRLALGLGDERNLKEIRAARDVWHRVLAAYLIRANGATLDSMERKFGWFELRLTRRETIDLIRSAKAAPKPLIGREIAYAAKGSSLRYEEVRWIATVDTPDPRGASWGDMGAALPNVLRATGARLLGSVSTLALIGAALGLIISKGSNEALFFFVLGAYGIVVALAFGVLSHERALTAAAKAWPRLEAYRPARWRFEMRSVRSPGPWAVAALATVGLLLAAYLWLRSADPWFVSDAAAAWIAGGCGLAVGLAYIGLEKRVSPDRKAWKAELARRRPLSKR